jgi:hypothetical protein
MVWPPKPGISLNLAYDCQPLMTHGSILNVSVGKIPERRVREEADVRHEDARVNVDAVHDSPVVSAVELAHVPSVFCGSNWPQKVLKSLRGISTER